jgi:hypothetical protein
VRAHGNSSRGGGALDEEGDDGALGGDEHVGPLAGDSGPAGGEHVGDGVCEVGPGEGDRAGDGERGGLAGGDGGASERGAVACPMHGSTWGGLQEQCLAHPVAQDGLHDQYLHHD